MRLRTNFLLFILLPTIMLFAGTIVYVSMVTKSITEKNAEELLIAHGKGLAYEIQQGLETPLAAVQMISQTYEEIISNGDIPSRDDAIIMLHQLLKNNPKLISSWMYWDNNAFDGKDEEYKNKPAHDRTGQFIPMWSRNDMGDLTLISLIGYDTNPILRDNLYHVFQTGESVLFEPYETELNGKMQLITSIAVPIKVKGEVLGITGVDISLNDINQTVSEFSFYKSGYAGLISNEGTVIAHQDSSLIGTSYYESNAFNDESEAESLKESIKKGEVDVLNSISNALQVQVYRLFTPVTVGDMTTPWSAFIAVPENEVKEDADSLANTIISISAVVFVILLAIILIVTNVITNRIKTSVEHAKEIAVGDFSKVLPEKALRGKSEMAELARAFNEISNNMRKLIGKVIESTNEVNKSAIYIDQAAKQSSEAASEVATAISEVSSAAENQMTSAEESAKSIEEMSHGIQKNAEALSTLSEASNEMGQQANIGKEVVQLAIEQMDHIQHETHETKTVINKLQEQASKIAGIVSIITDISDQTNLLALNAAIESARAGEAGKGFAVVADEVRKLADQTNSSALDIQQLILAIQEHSNIANRSMNANEEEVNKGIERIREVEDVFTKIIQSIEYVVQEVDDLAAVMEEMSAISQEVTASSEEIASSAEDTSSHSEEVAAAAEEQLATMEEMAKTTTSLRNLAKELNEVVSQFKI